MSKTPSIIAAVLTVILLLLLGILGTFMTLLALNGFNESQGGPALITTLVCNGIGIILSAVLAWNITRWLTSKFQWNPVLAVAVSVFAAILVGFGISLVAMFAGVVVADTLWQAR